MSLRSKAVLVLIVVALVVFIVGCGKKTDVVGSDQVLPDMTLDPGAANMPDDSNPIKIGAIFSVTGPAAPLGVPEKETAEMLADQLNEAGGLLGRKVEVIIKDDKSEPTEAALAATDLINNENVAAIIGPSRTPCALAIIDICEEAEVPLIACAAGGPITSPVKKWVFAVPQTDILAVAKIIDYLQAKKITKVASIYVSNGFGESGQQQLEAQLKDAGISLLASETFGGDDTDMTAQVTRIAGKSPQAVICWGTNPGPATVARNMKTLGLSVPLIQSHGVANADFIKLAGDAADGVMLPAGRLIVHEEIGADDPQKALLSQYAADFKGRYNKPADTFGGHAFDSLTLIAQAIRDSKSDKSDLIRNAIEMTQNFVGTAGVFNYSATDHNGLTKDAFVWVTIKDGTWKLAEAEVAGQ